MSSYKFDRVCEDIKREITDIIRGISDPRVKNQILTIMSVVLSKDMSYAKIYVSSMDGIKGSELAVAGLTSAEGFIKRELRSRMEIRRMPELRFIPDNSLEDTINLFNKL